MTSIDPPFDAPAFLFRPMTEVDGKDISAWRYEPPYDIYNTMAWDEMKERQYEFADPDIRAAQYLSVTDSQGELIGFCQLFPMNGLTRLGLGLRPDLRGKGWGSIFTRAIVHEALLRNPDHEIDLEVLAWNERAINTYRKTGFEITDTYERNTPSGPGLFHCMVYT
ncbi:GNAT family N-acetyltransferase [Paenibacillus gansuensis]|uniref:GNAT family N-acetyltransferase n=1 Tax=Paenibacillus gansuensis TaxID=306542 RepID=A0ABW5PJK4_9BACL